MAIKGILNTFAKTGTFALLSWVILGMGSAKGQQSVHSSGGSASGSGGLVSFSIGQVCYSTQSGVAGQVCQGVQQAYELVTSDILDADMQGSIRVFPNPTLDYLILQVDANRGKDLSYQLCDLQGKVLKEERIVDRQTLIPTKGLSAAMYLIQVMDVEVQARVQTFKVIKTD